jgi:hypothetical protein
MLGFGDKQHTVDPTTLPIFVHTLQSNDAFALAQKVWESNSRYIMVDAPNHKELLRFVFNEPSCVVWLGHDQGRSDSFEMVLMWDAKGDKQDVSEVYVLTPQATVPLGDDSRVKDLLSTILSSPSVVPVNNPVAS